MRPSRHLRPPGRTTQAGARSSRALRHLPPYRPAEARCSQARPKCRMSSTNPTGSGTSPRSRHLGRAGRTAWEDRRRRRRAAQRPQRGSCSATGPRRSAQTSRRRARKAAPRRTARIRPAHAPHPRSAHLPHRPSCRASPHPARPPHQAQARPAHPPRRPRAPAPMARRTPLRAQARTPAPRSMRMRRTVCARRTACPRYAAFPYNLSLRPRRSFSKIIPIGTEPSPAGS